MKRSSKIIIGVVTSLALTTGLIAGEWHSRDPEEKMDYMVSKITKKLDLNDAQVVELEKLKTDILALKKEFIAKKSEHHETLFQLFSQPTLDQQSIVNLVTEHTIAINAKAPVVVASMAGFYDSLTPEQQTKLRDKLAKHHKQGHHSHH